MELFKRLRVLSTKTYNIRNESNKIVPDPSDQVPGLAWKTNDNCILIKSTDKSKDCLIDEIKEPFIDISSNHTSTCKYIELPNEEVKDESDKIESVYEHLISHRSSIQTHPDSTEELSTVSDGDKSFFRFICPPFFILIVGLVEIIVYACGDTKTKNLLMYSPYQRYQVWRYVTYMLIHSDVIHLTLNILLQTLLATPLEFEQSWWRCAIIYISGGVMGALGASILQPTMYMVGASAGVYAILVSHVANVIVQYGKLKYKYYRLFSVAVLACTDIAFSVAHYKFASEKVSPIGWAAHCAGAFTGITLGLFIYGGCDKRKIYVKIASYASLLLFLTGVIILILLNIFYIKI